MSRIFSIGWAKTGTTTLSRCIEILGYDRPTQNMELVGDLARNDLRRIMLVAQEKKTFRN